MCDIDLQHIETHSATWNTQPLIIYPQGSLLFTVDTILVFQILSFV